MSNTQTKKHSLIESVVNVVIGYIIAIISQVAIFPIYGITIPLTKQLTMGLWFTVISIVRSYVIRRYFNSRI